MSGGEHSRGWVHAAEGLRLLFWALLLSGVAWAVGGLVQGLLRHALMGTEGYLYDSDWMQWLVALSAGRTALDLCLSVLIVLAMIWLVRLPADAGAGNWLSMALVASVLLAVLELFYLTVNLTQGFGLLGEVLGEIMRWTHWVHLGVRLALLWKIGILVGSLIFGVIAGLSRSVTLIQFVLAAGALMGLGTSAWMLWGLFRYLGLGVLVLAIVTLVVYIKLVGCLARAAEERGEQELESAFD